MPWALFFGPCPRPYHPAPCPSEARLDAPLAEAAPARPVRLPAEDPQRARLRRRHRDRARPGAQPVAAPGQPRAAQARGPAVGVQLQAARRLQQDGAPAARATGARRDLRLGRQPCAGRGAERAQARLQGGDRDAGDHAAAEGRRGARAGRRGRAARRQLLRRLRARAGTREVPGPELRAPLRRPGRDRRPGHDRDGDPAPAPGPHRRGVRGHRRRRADLRRGRLHQGGAPADPGDRRADRRFRRHAALGARRQARGAGRRRPVRRRHRGQAGGRRDLPPGARAGRRLRGRRHRRGLRRHQGRVPGHAQHPRALGRDGRGGDEAVRRDPQAQGQDLRRHHLRRQHELRPAALRRRARRVRRAARGAVRGDHPRGARLLQALLRADRPARGDRVQLPHRRHARGACLRRHRHRAPRRGRPHRAQLRAPRLRRPST